MSDALLATRRFKALVSEWTSKELAMAFRNLHEEVLKRFELLIEARTPSIPPNKED